MARTRRSESKRRNPRASMRYAQRRRHSPRRHHPAGQQIEPGPRWIQRVAFYEPDPLRDTYTQSRSAASLCS